VLRWLVWLSRADATLWYSRHRRSGGTAPQVSCWLGTAQDPTRARESLSTAASTVADRVQSVAVEKRGVEERKIGVLLLNLGGPDTLQDVQPFLKNLFADDSIIRLPTQGMTSSETSRALTGQWAKELPTSLPMNLVIEISHLLGFFIKRGYCTLSQICSSEPTSGEVTKFWPASSLLFS
jgi:Ferrochelatase